MAQIIKSLYAIALIASLASSAFAITCNICDSNNDFKCRDPRKDGGEFLSDCYSASAPSYLRDDEEDLAATGCMVKIVEEDGKSRVIRSCYWGNISDEQKGCRNAPWSTYTTLSCFVCEIYACNSVGISIFDDGIEMSSSCVTESIAVVIALFFAITRWMS